MSQRLVELYRELLVELGEDPDREGLLKTPGRAALALREFTRGYGQDVEALLNGAIFEEEFDDMIIVRDIEYYSLCVPSKQVVNAVRGKVAARDVSVGEEL